MVERLLCKQDVAGSIPVVSTISFDPFVATVDAQERLPELALRIVARIVSRGVVYEPRLGEVGISR